MLVIFWTECISALVLMAGIHSTTNSKTYEQGKNFFNSPNTQSSSRESLKQKCIRSLPHCNNDNKILHFFYFHFDEEGCILLENIACTNVVYISYYIFSKVLFSVTGYLKRSNEIPTSI